MATDEEYLDSLLRSMTEGEPKQRSLDDVMKSMNKDALDTDAIDTDILADMLDKIEETEASQPMIEEIQDGTSVDPFGEFVFQDTSEPVIEAISPEELATREMSEEVTAASDASPIQEVSDDMDVTELIDNMDHTEDDLLEINDLLKKADNNEYIEAGNEDIMSLLGDMPEALAEAEDILGDSISENGAGIPGELLGDMAESSDIKAKKKRLFRNKREKKKAKKAEIADNAVNEVNADNVNHAEKQDDDAGKSGFFKGLFGKKNRKNEAVVTEETSAEAEVTAFMDAIDEEFANTPVEDDGFADHFEEEDADIGTFDENLEGIEENLEDIGENLEDIEEKIPPKTKIGKKDKSGKKPGVIARILEYLTHDDEEEDTAKDNEEILEELAKEDEKAVKAKEKAKKKAEKKEKKEREKKEKPGKAATDEKKLAKQQAREEKKRAKAESAALEKPIKVLGKKGKIVAVAFCASLIAAVFALSTFLPEYADKQKAKEAFYIGDYENVYKLLFGKQLNAHDQLLFDRAETVLILERRLESYENNKILGRETEALDALIQGVVKYGELERVDEIGARAEVDVLYTQICSILLNNYALTPENALEIYTFDRVEYTRTLMAIVAGEGFDQSRDADSVVTDTEEAKPQDLLPEEEEFINRSE